MDILSQIPQYVEILLTIVGAISVIVRGIASAWQITPGTPDTQVFTRAQRFIHKLQKALGPIAGDTSKAERKNHG